VVSFPSGHRVRADPNSLAVEDTLGWAHVPRVNPLVGGPLNHPSHPLPAAPLLLLFYTL